MQENLWAAWNLIYILRTIVHVNNGITRQRLPHMHCPNGSACAHRFACWGQDTNTRVCTQSGSNAAAVSWNGSALHPVFTVTLAMIGPEHAL